MNVFRKFTVLAVSMLASAQLTAADLPPPWVGLESRWNQAHLDGDLETLDALWSDGIRIVVPGMAPISKAEALDLWRTIPVRFTDYRSTDVSVDVRGDTAIVTGRITRTRQFGERVASDQWQFIKVYGLQDHDWRVLHFVASPAPDP